MATAEPRALAAPPQPLEAKPQLVAANPLPAVVERQAPAVEPQAPVAVPPAAAVEPQAPVVQAPAVEPRAPVVVPQAPAALGARRDRVTLAWTPPSSAQRQDPLLTPGRPCLMRLGQPTPRALVPKQVGRDPDLNRRGTLRLTPHEIARLT